MTEPLGRYNVTVTVARDGSHLPSPAEFAVAAKQAASARKASIVSAHTAEQIISVVTVETADQSAAVAVALAAVSEALRCPVVSSSIYGERIGQVVGSRVRRPLRPEAKSWCGLPPPQHV